MRLVLNYFLFLYSAERDGEGQLEINRFAKNVVSIVKTVAKRKFCLLSGNPLVKRVVSKPKSVVKRKFDFARTNPLGKYVVSSA